MNKTKEFTDELIKDKVNKYYWEDDINCATTMIKVLSEVFDMKIHPQVIKSATGMHGAGEYGAQCGLVEGMLMFLGIYCCEQNLSEEATTKLCNKFAKEFEIRYTSLLCSVLRPEGFKEDNPPHLCEGFTYDAVKFTIEFIEKKNKE